MVLPSTHPLTEMITRNLPGVKDRPTCKTISLTAISQSLITYFESVVPLCFRSVCFLRLRLLTLLEGRCRTDQEHRHTQLSLRHSCCVDGTVAGLPDNSTPFITKTHPSIPAHKVLVLAHLPFNIFKK
jgi:hypothetical protein